MTFAPRTPGVLLELGICVSVQVGLAFMAVELFQKGLGVGVGV